MENPGIDFYFNPIDVDGKYIITLKYSKQIAVREEDFIEKIKNYRIYYSETEGDFLFVNEKEKFYGRGQLMG
jgi:hypothetical protein